MLFNKDKLLNHYQYLFGCRHLKSLEKLVVRDTRLKVDWAPVLNMNSDNFPKLTYLEIPYNAVFDYKPDAVKTLPNLPNLHLKYSASFASQSKYVHRTISRFNDYHGYNSVEVNKKLSAFKCDKLELHYPIIDGYIYHSTGYFGSINSSNLAEHDKWGAIRDIKFFDYQSKDI